MARQFCESPRTENITLIDTFTGAGTKTVSSIDLNQYDEIMIIGRATSTGTARKQLSKATIKEFKLAGILRIYLNPADVWCIYVSDSEVTLEIGNAAGTVDLYGITYL